MKNLLTRLLTGLIFVVVILGSLFLGEFAYATVFAAVLLGAMIEFYGLFKGSEYKPNKPVGYTAGLLVFALFFLTTAGYISPEWDFCIFPVLLIILIIELYRKKSHPIENMALSIMAILYLAIPLGLINFLVFPGYDDKPEFSPDLLIAVLVLIWVYDSAAYLFGVSIGKHRLFERISPKKSWEGAIGGAITTALFSLLVHSFIPEVGRLNWIILSILIVCAATFGDLTESLIKRTIGIKDSSNILPGHGGILDRFDSLFFVVPVVVVYFKLFVL